MRPEPVFRIFANILSWMVDHIEDNPVGVCRCGCDANTHMHYRPGFDCGQCGASWCRRFKAAA